VNDPRSAILLVGGSDSSGLAGVQADLATLRTFGWRGCTAITALTAQTPDSIIRIEPASLDQMEAEVRAAFVGSKILAIKTGMLFDADHVRILARLFSELVDGIPFVLDPVIRSTSGRLLLDAQGIAILKQELAGFATLITPNIPELQILAGGNGNTSFEAKALALAESFECSILLKGGHAGTAILEDLLVSKEGHIHSFRHNRLKIENPVLLRGTGCRLGSAIAVGLAEGLSTLQATTRAIDWLQKELSPIHKG